MNEIKLDLYPPFKKSGSVITQRTSGNEIHSTADLYFSSGKAIQTGITAADTLLFQAYDTDGVAYVTFGTLTAGTTPSLELDGAILDTSIAKGTWTASGTWTIPAVTLSGAVAGGDQTFTNVGDMTFAAGSILASGSTNGNTLLIGSNDTTFITITSGATDTCVLASTVTGTTQSAADNSTKLATTAYVDAAVGTVNSFAEILALSNITGANNIVVSTTQGINTALVDDNYYTLGAVANTPNTISEVARVQGAVDPYFSIGGTQQFKFYNSGVALFNGAATGAYFMSIAPTLTGPAATNTYAVNISPVGITIPTGTTDIAASLYVAEPIFTETGILTLGTNVYIDAAPTEGATNYSLYVVGTSYFGGTITGTLATAAQTNITSLGTLTSLTMGGSIVSDTDITDDLGTGDIRWNDIYAATLNSGLTATNTLKLRGRDVNGTAWVDILTITSADTVTADLHSSVTIGGSAIIYSGGALGTPSSGTLTNCTGLPAAAVVAGSLGTGAYVMDSSLQVSTIELGHATQNTLSASAGVLSIEGVVIPTISSTNTLTNKRITQRVVTTTDDATAVIDVDVTDVYELSAIANATEFTLTGTPTNGQKLIVRCKDAGVAKGLTWTGFTVVGTTLPITTVAGKWHYVGCQYNLAATTWHVLAVNLEA